MCPLVFREPTTDELIFTMRRVCFLVRCVTSCGSCFLSATRGTFVARAAYCSLHLLWSMLHGLDEAQCSCMTFIIVESPLHAASRNVSHAKHTEKYSSITFCISCSLINVQIPVYNLNTNGISASSSKHPEKT